MNIGNILGNIGNIALDVQLALAVSGKSNITVNEIVTASEEIANGEAGILAGKALPLFSFAESESGHNFKVKLYAVLEGGAADTAIKSTLV